MRHAQNATELKQHLLFSKQHPEPKHAASGLLDAGCCSSVGAWFASPYLPALHWSATFVLGLGEALFLKSVAWPQKMLFVNKPAFQAEAVTVHPQTADKNQLWTLNDTHLTDCSYLAASMVMVTQMSSQQGSRTSGKRVAQSPSGKRWQTELLGPETPRAHI